MFKEIGKSLRPKSVLKGLLLAASALAVFAFVFSASRRAHDFIPYHLAVRDLLQGNHELYGQHFGYDWPLVYRLLPWFAIIFPASIRDIFAVPDSSVSSRYVRDPTTQR